MAAIQVQDLRKVYRVHQKPQGLGASVRSLFRRRYKDVRAVDGITFQVETGEMVGFLGPNGAGKTTTLKILSGLIYPTDGQVRVLDFIPWERRNAYRRLFALLMGQKNQLWWDLPAAESFRLHKEIYSIDDKRFFRVQGELTELLQVGDLLNQPVRELSLGERMKMELIAALLHSPKVLFLDEPTIGLDVTAQVSIRKCLREYNEQNEVTIVLTSHYMKDIEALCDRVIVINHGKLIHDGPLSEIVDRFADHKLITLQFANGDVPERFDGPGDLAMPADWLVKREPPKVTLRIPRGEIAKQTARLLDAYEINDISVEDPPIEDTISRMFTHAGHLEEQDDPEMDQPDG